MTRPTPLERFLSAGQIRRVELSARSGVHLVAISKLARGNTEANRRREFLTRLDVIRHYLRRLVMGGVSRDDDRFVEANRQVNELEEWKADDEAERDGAA